MDLTRLSRIVEPKCRVVGEDDLGFTHEADAKPIKCFRELDAYVLLGPPGMGKSTAFQLEAQRENCVYVTARDFVALPICPNWREKTLFIDGLDEVRCGTNDKRVPFDQIRAKLMELNRPRFRLSCRETDWLGLHDERDLRLVAKNNYVQVLQLQELSLGDVRELLTDSFGIIESDAFIEKAKNLGVEELLVNPQSLQMLTAAVSSGQDWPRSRFETFTKVCEILIRECNEEHTLFGETMGLEKLLEAAGQLCAMLLLTGRAGYSQQFSHSEDLLFIGEAIEEPSATIERVLASKLFRKTEVNSYLPAHLQIAEFLAGRYLARLIEGELSVERILSLVTYADGAIVSQMRGTCAWMAACSTSVRQKIISRDPIGTVFFGDVKKFSVQSKEVILKGFREHLPEDRRLLRTIANDGHLGDLATPDARGLFVNVLSSVSPDDKEEQYFALCLISALKNQTIHQELCEALWRVVRNSDWHEEIRVRALELLWTQHGGDSRVIERFEGLLRELQAKQVTDSSDELRGTLLERLMGNSISLPEITDFLDEPANQFFSGAYQHFWSSIELNDVPIEEIGTSLDRIVGRLDRYRSPNARLALTAELHGKVFFKFLTNFLGRADASHTDKLIRWLETATELNNPASDATRQLKQSLMECPNIVKDIVLRFVEQHQEFQNFDQRVHRLDMLLLNINFRTLLGTWFLDQAIQSTSDRAAKWFIDRMASVVHSGSESRGALKSTVEKRLQSLPLLSMAFKEGIAEFEGNEQEWIRQQDQHRKSRLVRQEEWQAYLAEHESEVRENRLPLGTLHQLAQAYFGEDVDVEGNTPSERLQDLLGDNDDLMYLAMQALQDSILRDDVPSQERIFELRRERKTHLLSLPILAGLQQKTLTLEEVQQQLLGDEQRVRSALAAYYTVRVPQDAGDRGWVECTAKSNAKTLSAVLVEAVRLRLEMGEDCRDITHQLFERPSFEESARLSLDPLLKIFPVRCRNSQLPYLATLLAAATTYGDPVKLKAITRSKLLSKGMNIGQRVYWLGMGMLIDRNEYYDRFRSNIGSNDQRIDHFVRFLGEQVTSTKWIDVFELSIAEFLIQLIGCRYRPVDMLIDSDLASRSLHASRCVSSLLDQIAQDPTDAAVQCLNALQDSSELLSWDERIEDALHRQKMVRRECDFKYSNVSSVKTVFEKKEPANISDLKSVAVEALDGVRSHLQDGDTSGWRKFWNVNSRNRVDYPKPENACRDILADDFRHHLNRFNVDVHAEKTFANDKRCDLTAEFGNLKLPIEVKLSHSPDLWTAIENQLVPKYTRDPESGGHGIYVVFWFGTVNGKYRPTPRNGIRPRGAKDFENRLLQTLSSDLQQKISVYAIDVERKEA